MTEVVEIKRKKIAVIVPSEESLEVYNAFLSRYSNFLFKHYHSFDEFNKDMSINHGCDGFVIDWKIILKSSSEEKEYFKHLMKLFPTIRISHSLDKKEISGDFRGRMFKDQQLFDYFFCEVFPEPADKDKKEIILIVENKESRSLYESYMRTYPDISFHSYSSVKDFTSQVEKDSFYSGFVIDLRTIMKESPEDRALLHELIEHFPAIRISRVGRKKHIKGAISGKNFNDRELFDYFVKDLCIHFIPRGIRTKKRRIIFLNVSIDFSSSSTKNVFNEKLFKTNTIDVSDEGAFISGSMGVKKEDNVHLVIRELTDQSPIECTVIWVQPWGETIKHPAGFGVLFTGINPQQKEELAALLRKRT